MSGTDTYYLHFSLMQFLCGGVPVPAGYLVWTQLESCALPLQPHHIHTGANNLNIFT